MQATLPRDRNRSSISKTIQSNAVWVNCREEQLAIHQQANCWKLAANAQVTIESLITEAEAARAKAMEEKGGAAAAVSALIAKAKLAGMWREKIDQHNTGTGDVQVPSTVASNGGASSSANCVHCPPTSPPRASPDLKIKNSPDKISCKYQLRERSVNKYLRWHDRISRPGQDPPEKPFSFFPGGEVKTPYVRER